MWIWLCVWFVGIWVWALVVNYRVSKRERAYWVMETRYRINCQYQDAGLPTDKWASRHVW